MWRPARGAMDGTAVLAVRWAYRPVPAMRKGKLVTARRAMSGRQRLFLFSLSRLPVCESKREGTGVGGPRDCDCLYGFSSASYGPETVWCDRWLAGALLFRVSSSRIPARAVQRMEFLSLDSRVCASGSKSYNA